jgi:hypothetical protein
MGKITTVGLDLAKQAMAVHEPGKTPAHGIYRATGGAGADALRQPEQRLSTDCGRTQLFPLSSSPVGVALRISRPLRYRASPSSGTKDLNSKTWRIHSQMTELFSR